MNRQANQISKNLTRVLELVNWQTPLCVTALTRSGWFFAAKCTVICLFWSQATAWGVEFVFVQCRLCTVRGRMPSGASWLGEWSIPIYLLTQQLLNMSLPRNWPHLVVRISTSLSSDLLRYVGALKQLVYVPLPLVCPALSCWFQGSCDTCLREERQWQLQHSRHRSSNLFGPQIILVSY